MIRATSGKFMLGGELSEVYRVTQSSPEVAYYSAEHRHHIQSLIDAELDLTFIVQSPETFIPVMDGLLGRGELIALGPGWLCNACGDYNPAGMTLCAKCGGPAKMVPFIAPHKFPFCLTQFSYHDTTGVLLAYASFISCRQVTSDDLAMLRPGGKVQLETLRNDLVYEPGYYLCKYCGMSVPGGDICPGCGGKRFPWQELVTLERTCVYCGRDVRGGIVCPGCGARIKGQIIKGLIA